MANNPKHMDNLKNIEQSNDEATMNGRKGGIANGKAQRLNIRLAKAAKYIDKQNLRQDKRAFKNAWKIRHIMAITSKKEELYEELKTLIEKMRMIRDCGSDSLAVLAIANNPLLAISKPEVVIKAQSEVWDRTEGKAVQSIVTTDSTIRKTKVVSEEDIKKEKEAMSKGFGDE